MLKHFPYHDCPPCRCSAIRIEHETNAFGFSSISLRESVTKCTRVGRRRFRPQHRTKGIVRTLLYGKITMWMGRVVVALRPRHRNVRTVPCRAFENANAFVEDMGPRTKQSRAYYIRSANGTEVTDRVICTESRPEYLVNLLDIRFQIKILRRRFVLSS